MRWLLVVALLCATAIADTGGRIGGGSWSGGSTPSVRGSSSGSFGGGSHWSDPPAYHYDPPTFEHHDSPSTIPSASSDYDTKPSREDDDFAIAPPPPKPASDLPFILGFCAIGGFILFGFLSETFDWHPLDRLRERPLWSHVDVGAIRIAIDGRARKLVQTRLREIAATTNTRDPLGRVIMLQKVSTMLRQLRDAWVYGGFVNEKIGPIEREKPIFDKLVDDTRAKFVRETISNVNGVQLPADPGHYVPQPWQGEGLILVSIIIAAYKELYTIKKVGNGNDLRDALEATAYLDENSLVAVEIIWQPSDDADRLSSIMLEAKYPAPQLVPIAGALVGKMFCAYCSGPFPRELTSCPHCGAPAREAA